jgi:hypothetical protein
MKFLFLVMLKKSEMIEVIFRVQTFYSGEKKNDLIIIYRLSYSYYILIK